MQTNETPRYDQSDNPTGCCPRFNTEGWDDQSLHFENYPFVHAKTWSLMHVPVNMGKVFTKTAGAIDAVDGFDDEHNLVLSRDLSPWSAEHLFAVTKDIPGQEMVHLSGDYRTKLCEGPYRDVEKWVDQFEDELEDQGLDAEEFYAFYTTCPKCAKTYGKNYVIVVARVEPDED